MFTVHLAAEKISQGKNKMYNAVAASNKLKLRSINLGPTVSTHSQFLRFFKDSHCNQRASHPVSNNMRNLGFAIVACSFQHRFPAEIAGKPRKSTGPSFVGNRQKTITVIASYRRK